MVVGRSLCEKLDVVVKSFNRPHYVERLVKSWNVRWPGLPLTIVDDSLVKVYFDSPLYRSHRIVRLSPDGGASYGRNQGVSVTKKPYILFLDDDFVIWEETDIENMFSLFSVCPDVGLVGGVSGRRRESCVCEGGLLEIRNGICSRIGQGNKNMESWNGIPYRFCDLTQQFIMADRRLFDDVKWDNTLKTSEHVDFFLAIKQTKWKVVFTPSSSVDHRHDLPSPNYFRYRYGRQGEYRRMVWEKWGLMEEVYEYDGVIQKRWITPDVRIDYDDSGNLRVINKRLHDCIIVESNSQGTAPEDKMIGTVISVGVGAYGVDGRPTGCQFEIGNKVYYRVNLGQFVCINGKTCAVLPSSEVWAAE